MSRLFKRYKLKTKEELAAEWAEFEKRMIASEKVIRENPGLFPVGPRNVVSEIREFVEWQNDKNEKVRSFR